MCLISSGRLGEVDGYIGYMGPYATSHQALDDDTAFKEETLNVAKALANAVKLSRAGKLENPGKDLVEPNSK